MKRIAKANSRDLTSGCCSNRKKREPLRGVLLLAQVDNHLNQAPLGAACKTHPRQVAPLGLIGRLVRLGYPHTAPTGLEDTCSVAFVMRSLMFESGFTGLRDLQDDYA